MNEVNVTREGWANWRVPLGKLAQQKPEVLSVLKEFIGEADSISHPGLMMPHLTSLINRIHACFGDVSLEGLWELRKTMARIAIQEGLDNEAKLIEMRKAVRLAAFLAWGGVYNWSGGKRERK